MASENQGILAGRRAIVTGAGRGIGRAIALAFALQGADLGLIARTPADLEAVAAEIRELGVRCAWAPANVTDPTEVRTGIGALLAELQGLDILVNNAGSGSSHKFLDHPDELWHQMLAVNLSSVYYVTKACVPALIAAKGGRIINMASIAARTGDRYIAAYTAAKHGVLGLTRALAAELRPYGITVNAICPAYVDTGLTAVSIENIVVRTGLSPAEAREALEESNPQHRLIPPEEVAAVAVFLAQPLAGGLTGQAINVDGGAVMS